MVKNLKDKLGLDDVAYLSSTLYFVCLASYAKLWVGSEHWELLSADMLKVSLGVAVRPMPQKMIDMVLLRQDVSVKLPATDKTIARGCHIFQLRVRGFIDFDIYDSQYVLI